MRMASGLVTVILATTRSGIHLVHHMATQFHGIMRHLNNNLRLSVLIRARLNPLHINTNLAQFRIWVYDRCHHRPPLHLLTLTLVLFMLKLAQHRQL